MAHPIELEVRAELTPAQVFTVRERLLTAGFISRDTTRRTMLMSFSQIDRIAEDAEREQAYPQETDIRCRITNGSAEVVVKLGGVHAHDRKEISTPIPPAMLPCFARVIGATNMFHKVGSRTTENFVRGSISAAIVSARSGLSYVELEKISDEAHAEADRLEVEALAQALGIALLDTREAYIAFCTRLTEQDDWTFRGTEEEVSRFLEEIQEAGSNRPS